MDFKTFQEQVFFCTARIVVPMTNRRVSVGTGFIIQAPVSEGMNVLLLVSNKHVFVGQNSSACVNFHRLDTEGADRRPKLGEIVSSTTALDCDAYTEHPDRAIDLACLNVSKIADPRHGIYYRTLPLEMAATFTESWLQPNGEVCFVGYPDGRYDHKNNLPILRRGTIATIPRTDFNGARQLVIDGHVHKGSSGSPVFAIPPPLSGGKARFIGVLTQTMVRGEALRPLAKTSRQGVQVPIGLGLVLKVDLVRELIDVAVEKVPRLPIQSAAATEPVEAA